MAPAMNTQDVRARGGPQEPRHARGARRPLRRARRGLSGVRLDRQGPARRARRDRRRGRRDAAARGTAARAARAGHRRADLRRLRSRCASSATDRAAAWASRSPPKPTRRGAEVTLVAGPTTIEPPRGARGRARAERRGDASGRHDARRGRGRRDHGGRGRRLHAGSARRPEGPQGRRDDDARAEEDARHPRRPRAPAAGVRQGPAAGGVRRRNRERGRQARPRSANASTSI